MSPTKGKAKSRREVDGGRGQAVERAVEHDAVMPFASRSKAATITLAEANGHVGPAVSPTALAPPWRPMSVTDWLQADPATREHERACRAAVLADVQSRALLRQWAIAAQHDRHHAERNAALAMRGPGPVGIKPTERIAHADRAMPEWRRARHGGGNDDVLGRVDAAERAYWRAMNGRAPLPVDPEYEARRQRQGPSPAGEEGLERDAGKWMVASQRHRALDRAEREAFEAGRALVELARRGTR